MKQFEIGKTYSVSSIGNTECVWSYTVIARTPCTIKVTDGEKVKTLRIIKQVSEWRNKECVMPLGNYSMAPILEA